MSQKLINHRNSHRRNVLRMETSSEAFDANSPTSAIESSLDLLEDYWIKFQSAQLNVEEKISEENLDAELQVLAETEMSYLKTKSILKTLLDLKEQERNEQKSGSNHKTDGESNSNRNVKLPKLEIPKFDGSFNNWATFRDLFTSMVIDEKSLTDGEKLQYLKPNVSGEAKDIVSEYKITDANFDAAWNALEERYENKRLQAKAHLTDLFNQDVMKTESAASLRLLLRTTQKCLRSLKSLGAPVDTWDWLLIHMTVIRLDTKTRRYWELTHTSKVMPTWLELVAALENRCNALESEDSSNLFKADKAEKKKKENSSSSSKVFSSVSPNGCTICNGSHDCTSCKEFLKKTLDGRLEMVRKHKLCYKCLKPNHNFRLCKAASCGKCYDRHHELLHNSKQHSNVGNSSNSTNSLNHASSPSTIVPSNSSTPNQLVPSQNHALVSSTHDMGQGQILLSTALVKVRSTEGNWEILRAFLDGGSQRNVVTEDCVQRLKLKRFSCEVPIQGIAGIDVGTHRRGAIVPLKSCVDDSFNLSLNAVVMKHISTDLPNVKFDISSWSYINGLELADHMFNEPGRIDLLIGAEFFLSLLKNEPQRIGPVGCPVAQSTHLGWILSGPVDSSKNSASAKIFSLTTAQSLSEVLSRFWEIEEIPKISTKSLEDKKCEEHFEKTYSRTSDGRFIVKLPFVDEELDFGETKTTALKRFNYLERRFSKDQQLQQDYVDQIRELESSGHAEPAEIQHRNEGFYLPHHAVVKPSRTTTKTRIVFDAAAKSSNGVSLNDKLMVGPRLQDDLLKIIIRFRRHRVVVIADIEKMFRQILVASEHQRYQKFLWRECSESAVRELLLTTVVFGTSCAPFLAVKVLQKLADLECNESSTTKSVILNDFFMDDLLTGGDESGEIIQLVSELQRVLGKGKFPLRKWISNDEQVLRSIDNDLKAIENIWNVPFQESCKALGLRWNPGPDVFGYNVKVDVERIVATKRSILSVIASLYDPLGLLAPAVIVAKLILQNIWCMGINWDERISDDIRDKWFEFRQTLHDLNDVTVPRWLGSISTKCTELHGFSDASDDAYSAVIYSRVKQDDGSYKTNLIIAKTRVAPIKRISTPKLELCGGVLLTRLLHYVAESLQLEKILLYAWTDNTAVLDWLRKEPIYWKTFVANRVSEIQTTIPSMSWRYVPSDENPADCASRGIDADKLKNHRLWWNGPPWLSQDESHWPNLVPPTNPKAEAEAKKSILVGSVVVVDDRFDTLVRRFSSLKTLKHIVAYVMRFIAIARGKKVRNFGVPSVSELDGALKQMIKLAQRNHFSESMELLKTKKKLKRGDKLLSLTPIIGDDGLLRVGGRLSNSSLNYGEKFPIILPKKDPLTNLIIRNLHLVNLHAGVSMMLSELRRVYWIISARVLVKRFTRNCIKCCRVRGRTSGQIMGDLPNVRVTSHRPFFRSAVDYAGPMQIKVPTMNVRKYDITKGYIAVFICLATKCIHLELASDQSSEKFLQAFKRFSSRRGKPKELRSDNGGNFVGSNNELARLRDMLNDQVQCEMIRKSLVDDGTDWSMVPPYTPHFNGLCEAAVKSAKYHLRRVLGPTPFTYEEMDTILCQIEAILNSRPLIPQSDDVNDLNVLTPGHFLIGEQLTAIPEPNLQDIKLNRLDRFQLMQRHVQDFWSKWSKEYLSLLQQRTKWKSPVENLKVGQLVTIKDDDTPPTKWLMGRVVKVKPGKDNCVRVVQLKTVTVSGRVKPGNNIREMVAELKTNVGIAERSVHNLCVLPLNDEE